MDNNEELIERYILRLKSTRDRLNPDVKQRWIAALRSGNYNQTKAILKNSRGYCCLGVLCAVENIPSYSKSEGDTLFEYKNVTGYTHLPGNMNKDYHLLDVESALTYFNDTGYTFDQIADLIETYL